MVLLAGDGWGSRAIAREVGCARGVVSRWRVRFAKERLGGLADAPRPGKPKTYGAGCSAHPGTARPAAARGLGALDRAAARHGTRRRQRPARLALSAGAADRSRRAQILVSLERPRVCRQGCGHRRPLPDPPDHAIVLAVDEKPAIQALERAQGYLKLPNGRSLHGQAHEYKRRGTTTLFAALEVATGAIQAQHPKRRRRLDFLDFMNEVVADHPDQQIHVILDNLKTHKPKRDLWLARHDNVHFHFTPTHASSLHQVEIGSRSTAAARLRVPAYLGVPTARGDRRLHRALQPARRTLPVAQGSGPSQEPRHTDHGLMMSSTSISSRPRTSARWRNLWSILEQPIRRPAFRRRLQLRLVLGPVWPRAARHLRSLELQPAGLGSAG